MSLERIKDAHELIAPYIHKTPVLTSATLNESVGRSIVFKCENLQKTGSFKARGALNAVCNIDVGSRGQGTIPPPPRF